MSSNMADGIACGMKIRLTGVGLIALGILFAVLFIYLPIVDGPDGFMGRVRLNALVFVPLSTMTGFAFLLGGAPVLEAFQTKPKSRAQMTLVLSIIIGSGILSGLGYWQIKTRWLRAAEPVILDASPKVPVIPERPPMPTFELPERPTL
jgi:hypothetical protein